MRASNPPTPGRPPPTKVRPPPPPSSGHATPYPSKRAASRASRGEPEPALLHLAAPAPPLARRPASCHQTYWRLIVNHNYLPCTRFTLILIDMLGKIESNFRKIRAGVLPCPSDYILSYLRCSCWPISARSRLRAPKTWSSGTRALPPRSTIP